MNGECKWEKDGSCGVWEHDHRPWRIKVWHWSGWSTVGFWLWSVAMVLWGMWLAK